MKSSLALAVILSIVALGVYSGQSSLRVEEARNSRDSTRTLRQTYESIFPIGAAIAPKKFLSNPDNASFLQKQYSSVTAENQMKPGWLQPEEGKFNWAEADQLVKFARQNNMKVRGHCLVWFKRMPSWFYWDRGNLASKELILRRLKTHIQTVVNRYKDDVYCWDVVNEAVSSGSAIGTFKPVDTLYQIAGQEYIEKAFLYAHEADPKAKLFYNDIGIERERKKSDKIYKLLKTLRQKGIPIHGVGIQSHIGIEGMSENRLRESIDRFSSIGLEIQITELDVSIYDKKLQASQVRLMKDEYTPIIQDRQSAIYEMIFRVCRENKDKVTGITFWAAADYPNYLTAKLGRSAHPYLFDENLRPKKAFYRVIDF